MTVGATLEFSPPLKKRKFEKGTERRSLRPSVQCRLEARGRVFPKQILKQNLPAFPLTGGMVKSCNIVLQFVGCSCAVFMMMLHQTITLQDFPPCFCLTF